MKAITLTLILIIVRVNAACNGTHPYSYNSSCYPECPWNPPVEVTYLDIGSNTCVQNCTAPLFADDSTKTCKSNCSTSPIVTYYDLNWQKCVRNCSSNPSQFALISNYTCLTYCPSPLYADEVTRTCVSSCPSLTYYQIFGSIRICVSRCFPTYYANETNNCVLAADCASSPVKYYGDDLTNVCVKNCPQNSDTYAQESTRLCVHYCTLGTFADPTNLKCVDNCSIVPRYYGSNTTRRCMLKCISGQFGDDLNGQCVQLCSNGSYGDYSTRRCVQRCPITQNTYADQTTRLCIAVCSPGFYADNDTRKCVVSTSCSEFQIGNPINLQCVNPWECSASYYVDWSIKLCVTRCPDGFWANLDNKYCQSGCRWNPPNYFTWKQNYTKTCVTKCPYKPRSFADNDTQTCLAICPSGTFGDPKTYRCVTTCPDGFHSDSGSNLCVSDCTTNTTVILYLYSPNTTCVGVCPNGYFADNTTMQCVQRCPNNTFGYTINHTCLEGCPNGLFADNWTQMCLETCPVVTGQFADDSSNSCVDVCPVNPDYYGQDINNGNRSCKLNCTYDDTFADPLTRQCVPLCNSTAGYFGNLTTKRCYLQCPSGYGQPFSKICVDVCPQSPYQSFGDNLTKQCVERCPNQTYGDVNNDLCVTALNCTDGTFADDSTNLCVPICPIELGTFGDPVTKKCVYICQFGYYADVITKKCQTNCSASYYKDNSTRMCVTNCPAMPDLYNDDASMSCVELCSSGYAYGNGIDRRCVAMCPMTPAYLADEQTKKCVIKCANTTYQFTNNTYRGCLKYCPPQVFPNNIILDLYADNTTWKCVPLCPSNYYKFKHPLNATIRLCVDYCQIANDTYYFADNATMSCVTQCPMTKHLTYGDRITFKCVKACSREQFLDNTTMQCQYMCSSGFFADNTTFKCLRTCPNGTYAQSNNRTCVRYCPKGFYGYNKTCISLCPVGTIYYSDNTTWMCVTVCPSLPDYYSDPNNQLCVGNCTTGFFANPYNRKCVAAINCTNGTVADPLTFRCLQRCSKQPIYFKTNTTNLCGPTCNPPFFADNFTNMCIPQCFAPYYGVNTIPNYICVQFCPSNQYKNDTNRICLVNCNNGTYADDMTMSCVIKCPDKYYGNSSNNKCVLSCAPLYANDATTTCVAVCPNNTAGSNHSWKCQSFCDYGQYAYNYTCFTSCPNGTYADNLTRSCVTQCPSDPFTYADPSNNKCVLMCSPNYYAYNGNRTCLQNCPDTYFKELTLRMCLTLCLQGYFGNPQNQTCVTSCILSNYSLANPTNRQCVVKCPSTPDLYGNANVCVDQCPNGLYAQNFTRNCVSNCPNVSLVYLNASWADNLTRRCVRVCSFLTYAYTNSTDNICLVNCPNGTFASKLLQTCMDVCPNSTYALTSSNQCVSRCPVLLFGDDHLHACVTNCTYNNSQYADNSTQMCVGSCPSSPDLYAQDSTKQCVLTCQPGYFAYNQTRYCVQNCSYPYFADLSTSLCVLDCPINNLTFADNASRTCISSCVNVTVNGSTVVMFADNSTRKCVDVCPNTPKLYGINATNLCAQSCPPGLFGDNDTNLCFDRCIFANPKFTWMDLVNHFCVKMCPDGYFADNYTFSCEAVCSNGTFADNSTNRCVFQCPVNPSAFGYITNKTCIYMCPTGLFSDQVTRNCIPVCPTAPNYYFHYLPTNKCVRQCIYPYFGQLSSQNCVNQCQDGYYGNLTTHKCQSCRTQCITCSAYLQCLSCSSGFFLYQFECVTSCPSYPTMYFAHLQSATCFLQCPSPFFGLASTGLCQLSCPVQQYANPNNRTCTPCPTGCVTCDMYGCYTCQSMYVYVNATLKCNKQCNSTHYYFFNTTCYQACPDGSYLSADKVTCLKCNELCATCNITAINCTKCATKFYYVGACIDACPNNFFVDSNLTCIACSTKPQKCILPPLSYKITTFTQMFRLNAYVVFNRPPNMTLAQFSQNVKLILNNKIAKPNQFTSVLFNKTTFKVTFLSSQSLNQNSLSVGFTPGSIVDQYGNVLSVNEVTTSFQDITGVNESISNTSSAVSSTTQYLSWILLVILLLFMLKGGYPILIAIETVQIIFMHTYITINPIPYLQYKFLDSLKLFHFLFLPSMFPDAQYTIPQYSYFWSNASFLRNSSPFFIIFIIIIGIYAIFSILSNKSIIKNKPVRKFAKHVRKYRLKYAIINEAFWFTYLFVVFVCLLQFKQISFNGILNIMNILLATAVFILYMIFTAYVIYLGFKYRKDTTNIPKKHSFIIPQPSSLSLELPGRYLRKLLLCLALLIPHAQSQIIIIIMINSIFLIYMVCLLPAKSLLTNAIVITIEITYIITEALLFAYTQLIFKTLEEQMAFAITLVTLQGILLAIILIWILYRFALAISETQCWQSFINKATANTDPEYLKEQQRKRDLEFDFGSLEHRSDDDKTEHLKPNKLKYHKQQQNLDTSKDNIFNSKEDSDEQPSSKALGRLSSPLSDQNNPLFQPRKTKGEIKKGRTHALLQVNEVDKYSDLEEINLKREAKQQLPKQKQQIVSEKDSKKVMWQDISLDEDQI